MIDNVDEFESVSLIRFPERVAAEINEKLNKEKDLIKGSIDGRIDEADMFEKRLQIKFNQDRRNCSATWQGQSENITMKERCFYSFFEYPESAFVMIKTLKVDLWLLDFEKKNVIFSFQTEP